MTVVWHGVTLDDRTAAMMDEVEAILGYTLTATQGSYSAGDLSAETHLGGGAIDVIGGDLDLVEYVMRSVGFAAYHRGPPDFGEHVHGIAVGCPDMSSAAAQQVASYFAGFNALRSNLPDTGTRAFVGVTWETYTGAPELPTGDRPIGAPFWGESLPLDDSDVLAGAPAYHTASTGAEVVNSAAGFAATKIDTGSGNDSDDWVACSTGDSVLWIISDTGTYLAGGETGIEFRWMIRARGTGTLACFDDVDPAWSYSLPSNSLGTVTVAAADWTDYPIPTTTPTVASILDGDGQRFAVQVTGDIDIVRICLALVPVGGVVGDWGSELPSDDVEVEADRAHLRGQAIGTDAHLANPAAPGVDYAAAWVQASSELTLGIVQASSNAIVIGGLDYQAGVDEFDIGFWSLTVEVAPISLDLWAISPIPDGIEGIDYIRRPDRTAYDDDAYFRYDGAPVIAFWENNFATFDTDFNDLGADWYLRKLDYTPIPSVGTVAIPEIVLAPIIASGDASVPTVVGLGLDSSDEAFNMAFMASFATDDPGPKPPGTSFAGQFRVYLGSADFEADPSTWDPLTAHVAVPNYQLWNPGRYNRPDDPDGPFVLWLRQRQRNDGLGNSVIRAKGRSSRQRSLRQRGYR